MGVIALRPMLNAGYDVRLASRRHRRRRHLGILIPPSVMLIVYAAVAGQSIVKLYAAAMLPGFFLTFLYLSTSSAGRFLTRRSRRSYRKANTAPTSRSGCSDWSEPVSAGVGGLIAAALRPGLLRGSNAGRQPVGYGLISRTCSH